MITKIWSGQNKLYWLLIPFSLVYGLIVFSRRILYKFGLIKSWRAPIPVIVVGNLSVGGTGKTPLVIYLVEQFTAKGYKVGVVSRGYGGKSAQYPIIVTEQTSPKIAGDEPVLIYQRTHVPLAVSPIRRDAVQALLNHHSLDLIITDDGLQHYALQRNIEIVVIDGKRGFGNGWYLPAGPMREPSSRLNTVDYIVVNGNTNVDNTNTNNNSNNKNNNQNKPFTHLPTYTMELKPHYAINLLTKAHKPISELKSICAMAGIGDPNRFFTTLRDLNADLVQTFSFADHYCYSKEQLQDLIQPDQTLLMTEKDAVKCTQFALKNWWYLPIDAELPVSFFDDLFNKVKKLSK